MTLLYLTIRNINQKQDRKEQVPSAGPKHSTASPSNSPTDSHYDPMLNGHNTLHSYLDKPRAPTASLMSSTAWP